MPHPTPDGGNHRQHLNDLADGAHREPCPACGRWNYPGEFVPGGSVENPWVRYVCRDCGDAWVQGRDDVEHPCNRRCRRRCHAPEPER